MEVTVPEYSILPEVSLDPLTTALIVGDMQVDFASPAGNLFVQESRQTIPPIRDLILKAREAKAMVIYTLDCHRPDDPEFSIWGPHAVEGTPGVQVIPELAPLPEEYQIQKRTYDSFFGTHLDLLLRQKGIRSLVITGTVANICVLHLTSSACLRGYQVIVPVDTVSALHPFDYQAALRQISFVYQGKLTKSQGIKFEKN